MDWNSFAQEIEKVAASRMDKELAKGNLSDKSIQRIAGNHMRSKPTSQDVADTRQRTRDQKQFERRRNPGQPNVRGQKSQNLPSVARRRLYPEQEPVGLRGPAKRRNALRGQGAVGQFPMSHELALPVKAKQKARKLELAKKLAPSINKQKKMIQDLKESNKKTKATKPTARPAPANAARTGGGARSVSKSKGGGGRGKALVAAGALAATGGLGAWLHNRRKQKG